jgi:hypothetical protein
MKKKKDTTKNKKSAKSKKRVKLLSYYVERLQKSYPTRYGNIVDAKSRVKELKKELRSRGIRVSYRQMLLLERELNPRGTGREVAPELLQDFVDGILFFEFDEMRTAIANSDSRIRFTGGTIFKSVNDYIQGGNSDYSYDDYFSNIVNKINGLNADNRRNSKSEYYYFVASVPQPNKKKKPDYYLSDISLVDENGNEVRLSSIGEELNVETMQSKGEEEKVATIEEKEGVDKTDSAEVELLREKRLLLEAETRKVEAEQKLELMKAYKLMLDADAIDMKEYADMIKALNKK